MYLVDVYQYTYQVYIIYYIYEVYIQSLGLRNSLAQQGIFVAVVNWSATLVGLENSELPRSSWFLEGM